MILPGKFDVSESGSAVYTVPVSAVPGTAGLQPKLEFVYDSRGGNGLLGLGWSLAGLPSVTRCNRTIEQDGANGAIALDAIDRFCLDGQRLIAVSGTYGASGTEYRTERESFSRIVSSGIAGTGPESFTVWTKAGLKMEFGTTADSRIEYQGKTSVRVWAVSRVSDTRGNYFTVSYTEDNANGDYRPDRIDYTGNAAAGLAPFASMRFVYEARADLEFYFQAGSAIRPQKRLKTLQTYHTSGGTDTLVRAYQLTYDYAPASKRSRLTSLQLCASGGACLPATSFTWQGKFSPYEMNNATQGNHTYDCTPFYYVNGQETVTIGEGQTATFDTYAYASREIVAAGDWNGDGRVDAICRGGGTDRVIANSATAIFASQLGTLSIPTTSNRRLIVGDWNGDGRADFLVHYPGGGIALQVYLTNAAGTGFAQTGFAPGTWTDYEISTGDFNGDGRTDLFLLARVAGLASRVFFSDGSGGFTDSGYASPTGWNGRKAAVGDFNGDGLSDVIVYPASGAPVLLQLASMAGGSLSFGESQPFGGFSYSGQTLVPMDFNGDGLTDIFFAGSGGNSRVWLSAGNGSFTYYQPEQSSVFASGDFTGEGGGDLGRVTSSVLSHTEFTCNESGCSGGETIYTNTRTYLKLFGDHVAGDTLVNWTCDNIAFCPSPYTELQDLNGDGAPDLQHYDYWLYTPKRYGNRLSQVIPETMSQITTGTGASTKITYERINIGAGNLYAKDSTASYPNVDVSGPLWVVSQVDASSGLGGFYTSTYRYAGAKSHLTGRGFLGFREMTARDEQTGIEQVTTYLQAYPFTGLVAKREKKQGSLVLNRVTNSYAEDNLGGTRRFVRLTQSLEESAELNGTAMPTVTTTYQYDAFGNATQVAVSTPDGHSKTTVSTYVNDTANWLLGRLTSASVTSVTP